MTEITNQKLYHYCSADTALNAIKDTSICGYTPSSLDGITELNDHPVLNFDKHDLTKALVQTATSLIFGPDTPKGDTPVIAAISRWREAERFSTPEEAKTVLLELSEKIVEQRMAMIEKQQSGWAQLSEGISMLSFFEKNDNFSCWKHQGDAFSGIALEFNLAEKHSFGQISKITYNNMRPELTTVKEQMASIFYGAKSNPGTAITTKFSNKAPAFRNEKEWRVIRADQSEGNHNFNFSANELKAVYFGPNISEENKEALIVELKEKFKDVKINQLSFARGTFDLTNEQQLL